MHNLGTVFRFEVTRTIKKRSFWIVSLMFPLLIGVIAGIIYFSNKTTDEASKKAGNTQFSLAVTDESHLVNPALIKAYHAKTFTDKAAGIEAVKDGKLDAYIFYPKDIQKQKTEVYGKDVGLFDNSRYGAVAKSLLTQSAAASVKPAIAMILAGSIPFNSTTYKDGSPYNGFSQLIVPGVFLVLFYILITTFGSQMLSSTTEEKENRVIEMILTTIEARTLIVGKIFSLIVVGLLQVCIILLPIVIGYIFLHNHLSLPSIDLTHLVFNWQRIAISFVIFAISFVMFTGLLVAIGAAAPTAKEAGPFFGIVMMLIFGPLYAAPLFVSSPHSALVETLSFFPLTAPIPLMLRNAVGNLQLWEAALAIVILFVTTIIVMSIAIRTFRYGALEYSRRLSIKEIFTRS